MAVNLDNSEIHILDICYEIEKSLEKLYLFFSDAYSDNPAISSMWRTTSMDEGNHAELFSFASRLKGSGIESLKTDLYTVNNILSKVLSIYENVQKSPPPLKEALRFAVKLEKSLASYHMHSIANFKDEGLGKLFTGMLKADQEHIQRLERALEKYNA